MLDGGPFYGQQGYYAEYQSTGMARPNGQVGGLSRLEAIRLYEINLTAFHESGRKRERLIAFYTAVNLALLTGIGLVLSLPSLTNLMAACSVVALFVGWPICRAWRRSLDQCRQESDLAVGMIRKLEAEYGLRYSPLGEETKSNSKAEDVAVSRERYLPRLLIAVYIAVAVFLWRDEVYSAQDGWFRSIGNAMNWYYGDPQRATSPRAK